MNTRTLPTTSYAVLGVLSLGQMSGYDVASFAAQSIAHFWPIAKSQVYGELGRLEDMGLVEGTDVAQEGLPDKRVFGLTSTGREALDGWLAGSDYEPDRFRIGFLVKFFFGDRMAPEVLLELVTRYRDQSQNALDHFKVMTGQIPIRYPRMSAEFGLKHLEANIEWAEEVIDEIEQEIARPKATSKATKRKGKR